MAGAPESYETGYEIGLGGCSFVVFFACSFVCLSFFFWLVCLSCYCFVFVFVFVFVCLNFIFWLEGTCRISTRSGCDRSASPALLGFVFAKDMDGESGESRESPHVTPMEGAGWLTECDMFFPKPL